MIEYPSLRIERTLAAAGLPTDLRAIIGRPLRFKRCSRDRYVYPVIGITFGIGTLKLMVDAPCGLFKAEGLLFFDSFDSSWESWFEEVEEPELLVSVTLV